MKRPFLETYRVCMSPRCTEGSVLSLSGCANVTSKSMAGAPSCLDYMFLSSLDAFHQLWEGNLKNHKIPCLGKWILRDFLGNKQFLENVCSLGPRLQHFRLQPTLLALDRAPQSELALANISCYCLFWIQSFCVPTDSLSLSQVWSQGEIVSTAKDLCAVLHGGFFPSKFRAFRCTCGV